MSPDAGRHAILIAIGVFGAAGIMGFLLICLEKKTADRNLSYQQKRVLAHLVIWPPLLLFLAAIQSLW